MNQILLLILFTPSILFAQSTKRASIWLPVQHFVGTWAGEGGGEPGQGKYERSYQFVLTNHLLKFVINQPIHQLHKTQKEKHMKTLAISATTTTEKFLYSGNFMLKALSTDSGPTVFHPIRKQLFSLQNQLKIYPKDGGQKKHTAYLAIMKQKKRLNWQSRKKNFLFIQTFAGSFPVVSHLPIISSAFS